MGHFQQVHATAPLTRRTESSSSSYLAPAKHSYPAQASYMKHRVEGHTETTISGDTRADWSEAFELVPSLQIAYVWHRTVLTRTHYWYQHEPCWYVRKKNAPWFGEAGKNSTVWDSPSPKFIMGGSDEEKFDHPTQKPVELMRRPILNHLKRGALVYDPFLGSGTTLAAAELTERSCVGIELDPKYVDVVVQRWQTLAGKPAVLGDGDYKGATFEQVKEGRLREWQDQIGHEAFEAEKKAAAAEAGRAEKEGR
jgi:hypothetical protein